MDLRFEDFIKQGVYLRSWSPKTVRTYRQCLNALQQSLRESSDALPFEGRSSRTLTKTQLDAFVISMRQRGLSPGGRNMYIRTVNSYLSWLKEEGNITAPLKIKLLHPD